MIVSLRGTNGAGKSTIVRKIMKLYDVEHRMYEEGRKKPLATILRMSTSGPFQLMVPGHYEIANGGVDTLPSLDVAYQLIQQAVETDVHVLYEGKNMSDGPRRLIELHRNGFQAHVVAIKIDTDAAIAAVRKRGHSIKAETVARLNVKVQRELETLEKAGVPFFYGSRAAALKQVRKLLNV